MIGVEAETRKNLFKPIHTFGTTYCHGIQRFDVSVTKIAHIQETIDDYHCKNKKNFHANIFHNVTMHFLCINTLCYLL